MQVLAGDVVSAQQSYWHYFGLWQMFGALPERFLYPQGHLHPTQQQYPLRPELMESTFYLYQVGHLWTHRLLLVFLNSGSISLNLSCWKGLSTSTRLATCGHIPPLLVFLQEQQHLVQPELMEALSTCTRLATCLPIPLCWFF